jgi:hypothetical protein
VCGALLEHLQHGVQHTYHGPIGLICALGEAAQAIEVPEEFVGSVNEVDEHGARWVQAGSLTHAHDCGC